MSAGSRRDDIVGAIAVIVLLIGTATGNAFALLAMSVAALILLTAFYRRQVGAGPILVALVAAVAAAVIGLVVAVR